MKIHRYFLLKMTHRASQLYVGASNSLSPVLAANINKSGTKISSYWSS